MPKKLPSWGKVVYGAGAGGFSLIDRLLLTYLFYYYVTNPVRGDEVLISGVGFGVIMFLGRAVDALADPIIARWSDNYHNPLGRRMPFMLISGVLYVAVFLALFYPPVAGKSPLNSVYLVIMLGLYFALFTAYVCPYLALLPELARTRRDRVDLATYKAVFSILGVAIAAIFGSILIDTISLSTALVLMGIVALVFLYLPLLIKERKYALSEPATLGLLKALKTTFQNKPFLIYLTGNVAFWLGFNIVSINLPNYVDVLLGKGEGEVALYVAYYFGAVLVVAMLCFPLVNYFSKKIGLKAVMMFSLISFMGLLPWLFWFGQPLGSLLSADIFAFVLMAPLGIPVAVIFVVPDAIVASVSDLEEKLSGQRREAMYFGAQGFNLKLALGASTLITGLLLDLFGKTAELPLGIQLTGPVAAFFILIGVLIFSRYPESEVAAYQKITPGAGGMLK